VRPFDCSDKPRFQHLHGSSTTSPIELRNKKYQELMKEQEKKDEQNTYMMISAGFGLISAYFVVIYGVHYYMSWNQTK
jgi:hypothetical protein